MKRSAQFAAPGATDGRGPRHWTRVEQIAHLSAARFQDGVHVISFSSVDTATRRLVTEALGEVTHSGICVDPLVCALLEAAERLGVDRSDQLKLW